MAAARGLCRPGSTSTPVVSLAKAARPRRVCALRRVARLAGVVDRPNWVPSNATNHHPRQKASAWRARVARGRKARAINSATTCPGVRAHRSAHALSLKLSSKRSAKCSASVPVAFMK